MLNMPIILQALRNTFDEQSLDTLLSKGGGVNAR